MMQNGGHEKDPKYTTPVEDKKGKGKEAAKPKAKAVEKDAPPIGTRKGNLRALTIKAGQNQPEANTPTIPKEKGKGVKDLKDHDNYRQTKTQITGQYKPDSKEGGRAFIHPPKEDPNRLPPRPQDREKGCSQTRPTADNATTCSCEG